MFGYLVVAFCWKAAWLSSLFKALICNQEVLHSESSARLSLYMVHNMVLKSLLRRAVRIKSILGFFCVLLISSLASLNEVNSRDVCVFCIQSKREVYPFCFLKQSL